MDTEQQVVRSWENVRKMLAYRDAGAVWDDDGDDVISKMRSDGGTFSVVVRPDTAVVFHTAQYSVKKTDIFDKAGDAAHILVVVNTKGTSNSKPNMSTVKAVEHEASAKGKTVEFWTLSETQYNVSEHALVPLHVKVPPGEVDGLLRTLMVKNRYLLPAISSTDVMARYLLLRHGDVVRIERPSPTAGKTVFYRCCRKA